MKGYLFCQNRADISFKIIFKVKVLCEFVIKSLFLNFFKNMFALLHDLIFQLSIVALTGIIN